MAFLSEVGWDHFVAQGPPRSVHLGLLIHTHAHAIPTIPLTHCYTVQYTCTLIQKKTPLPFSKNDDQIFIVGKQGF